MKTIRVIRAEDGLYINLKDVVAKLKQICSIYPSRVSLAIYKMFKQEEDQND
jgi:hypothetical protein